MYQKFRGVFLIVCFLAVAVMASPQPTHANPPLQDLPNLAAVLEVTTDGVEILPNGTTQWIAVSGRSGVSAGDTIRTNNTGSAFLVWFEDGTLVEIEPNTWLYINEFKGAGGLFSIDVTLVVGRIFNKVNSLVDPNSRYTINTPTMQTSVRGTIFGVDVSPRLETTLAVNDGSVAGTQGTPASVLFEVNAGFWVRSGLQEPFGNPLTFAEAGNDPVVLALIAGGQNLQSGTPLSTPEPVDDTPRPATTAEPIGPAFTAEPSNDNTNDDHGDGGDDNNNDNGNDNNDNGGDDD